MLNLLRELQDGLGLTYLFVAHDLSVVRHISDRVAVMYVGKIVELAPVDRLFQSPAHPYTEALLSAVPVPNPKVKKKRVLLSGEVADPGNAPPGCAFHPRCPYAEARCRREVPELREIAPGHVSRCFFGDTLQLEGM